MKEYLKRAPITVAYHDTIYQALNLMVAKGCSSLLVVNENDRGVAGLVTERDIMRKLAKLGLHTKLDYKVSTIMTRDVKYVTLDKLFEQIKILHCDHGIRHFPVLAVNRPKPLIEDVMGMITFTDLGRRLLDMHVD